MQFELRYNEIERARAVFERYIQILPTVKSWVRYAKFEMKNGEVALARRTYERAVEELGEDAQTVGADARMHACSGCLVAWLRYASPPLQRGVALHKSISSADALHASGLPFHTHTCEPAPGSGVPARGLMPAARERSPRLLLRLSQRESGAQHNQSPAARACVCMRRRSSSSALRSLRRR